MSSISSSYEQLSETLAKSTDREVEKATLGLCKSGSICRHLNAGMMEYDVIGRKNTHLGHEVSSAWQRKEKQ